MKKAVIYYFSATGNSLAVARDIATIIDAQLVSITQMIKNNVSTVDIDSEVVGIVCPVYFSGIPESVYNFLKKLQNNIEKSTQPYFFAVCTCCTSGGGSLNMIASLLQEKKLVLSYGAVIQSVGTYLPMYDIDIAHADSRLQKASNKAKNIAELINNQKIKVVSPSVSILAQLIYKGYTDSLGHCDSSFSIDSSCNGCGECARVCPNANIKSAAGALIYNGEGESVSEEAVPVHLRPVFMHHCQQCMACINWCPQHAIQWKDSTKQKNRYHNPSVYIEDLCVSKIEQR